METKSRQKSPKDTEFRLVRNRWFSITILSAGDPQIPSADRGILPKKNPIDTWDWPRQALVLL